MGNVRWFRVGGDVVGGVLNRERDDLDGFRGELEVLVGKVGKVGVCRDRDVGVVKSEVVRPVRDFDF